MTIRIIAPHSNPSITASPPSDERHFEDENLAKILLELHSQTTAAMSCIENSQQSSQKLGYDPSVDGCIDLLRGTRSSLDKIFFDIPPQSDDKVVQESWSMIVRVKAKMESNIKKLNDLKHGRERRVEPDRRMN